MEKLDYKKKYKDLYLPKTKPSIVDVPEMTFVMVDGHGDPNTSLAYKNALEVLYGISYAIKMSKMKGNEPEGYFEYVVPPLEGLWWLGDNDFPVTEITDKSKFNWVSMIRQPEFVTPEVFEGAKEVLLKKNPDVDLSTTRLARFTEGLCAQVMHIGPYDHEAETIRRLTDFINESDHITDIHKERRHHEIYLGDPRKTAPEKLKTVIRHPIRKLSPELKK